LAGAFNANLLEEAQEDLEKKADTCEVRLVIMGKKAELFFKKQPFPVDISYVDNVEKLTDEDIKELSGYLIKAFVLKRTDAVYVAYNEFKSILAPKLTITKLLPLEPPEVTGEKEAMGEDIGLTSIPPDWEPGTSSFLSTLLPFYIKKQVLHFYLESQAAEQAARMMAMDNATKNAEDLIDDLTLVLNKIRQASITKELLEIISAVEALGIK
jgi:F-type H+-transporting ATPase subunit gamma